MVQALFQGDGPKTILPLAFLQNTTNMHFPKNTQEQAKDFKRAFYNSLLRILETG